MKLLFSPEPGTGDGGSPGPANEQKPPPSSLTTAAETVLSDNPSELDQLRKKLEEESQARRKAELDAAEAQDKVKQLVEIDSRRPSPSKKTFVKRFPWSPVTVESETDETQGEA